MNPNGNQSMCHMTFLKNLVTPSPSTSISTMLKCRVLCLVASKMPLESISTIRFPGNVGGRPARWRPVTFLPISGLADKMSAAPSRQDDDAPGDITKK